MMEPAERRANPRLVCRLQALQLQVDPKISMHFEGSDLSYRKSALLASGDCPSYSSKRAGT